jgi:peptidoglycan hydrolase-like protein with peptidoglycan-binding domain
VAGVAVAAAVGFGGSGTDTPQAGAHQSPATAPITRETLTETKTVSGTLGYGDTTTVAAKGPAGTITWLAPEGSSVSRGKPVYKVDAQPVVLLYGSAPFYRTLAVGLTGDDVKTLEANLQALGYAGFTVDDEFTSSTADAVKRWQGDLGVPETGRVEVSRVVIAPGQIRIAEHKTEPGSAANGMLLAYTGMTRVVTVALDVADQQLVHKGVSAQITLPDGTAVAGTVASVGTVATKVTSGNGANQTSTTTIDVVVSVADQKKLGTLDEAPVDVVIVADQHKNALTVPVGALVALQEGGYGVLVVDGGGSRYVAVKTGVFANGKVELTGGDVIEGMAVGVPR